MSVATAFKFAEAFPFCDASAISTYDIVAGLSLADAMALYWNLEDVVFTTAGSCTSGGHTASCAGTFKFNPPTVTGDYTNITTGYAYNVTSALTATSTGPLIGNLPQSTRAPSVRVCASGTFLMAVQWIGGYTSLYLARTVDIQMFMAKDPGDTTKYAIYYRFVIAAGDFNNAVVWFTNPAYSAGSSSGSFTTGTFSIGAATFNWRCYYNTSIVGESLSAAPSSYTYS